MKIVHIAWLGAQNYGDDLMAEAVQNYLNTHFQIEKYTIWSQAHPTIHKKYTWIYPPLLGNRFKPTFFENRALKKADLLLVGGGSVLHSSASSLWKERGIAFFKQNTSGAALGINVSVGPFKTTADEAACSRVLKLLDACTFRDKASFDFACALNLPYQPELTFDLAACYLEDQKILPREKVATIGTIGLTLREPERAGYQEIFNNYVALLKLVSTKYPCIRLFCFSGALSKNNEFVFCQKLLNAAQIKAQIIIYTGNAQSFTEEIKKCDFFISTRLHGLIVPYLLNIPFISLAHKSSSDHKKFGDFNEYIQLPKDVQFEQDNFTPSEIIQRIVPYELPHQTPFFELARKNFTVFKKNLYKDQRL